MAPQFDQSMQIDRACNEPSTSASPGRFTDFKVEQDRRVAGIPRPDLGTHDAQIQDAKDYRRYCAGSLASELSITHASKLNSEEATFLRKYLDEIGDYYHPQNGKMPSDADTKHLLEIASRFKGQDNGCIGATCEEIEKRNEIIQRLGAQNSVDQRASAIETRNAAVIEILSLANPDLGRAVAGYDSNSRLGALLGANGLGTEADLNKPETIAKIKEIAEKVKASNTDLPELGERLTAALGALQTCCETITRIDKETDTRSKDDQDAKERAYAQTARVSNAEMNLDFATIDLIKGLDHQLFLIAAQHEEAKDLTPAQLRELLVRTVQDCVKNGTPLPDGTHLDVSRINPQLITVDGKASAETINLLANLSINKMTNADTDPYIKDYLSGRLNSLQDASRDLELIKNQSLELFQAAAKAIEGTFKGTSFGINARNYVNLPGLIEGLQSELKRDEYQQWVSLPDNKAVRDFMNANPPPKEFSADIIDILRRINANSFGPGAGPTAHGETFLTNDQAINELVIAIENKKKIDELAARGH